VVNNHDFIFHKTSHKKGLKDMNIYSRYKKNHLTAPKRGCKNVFNLGYFGVKADFPKQLSSLQYTK
jgi:hypothetical protein